MSALEPWQWTILYLAGAGLVFWLLCAWTDDDPGSSFIFAMFWPIALGFVAFVLLVMGIYHSAIRCRVWAHRE
jgi:hypothetical protein